MVGRGCRKVVDRNFFVFPLGFEPRVPSCETSTLTMRLLEVLGVSTEMLYRSDIRDASGVMWEKFLQQDLKKIRCREKNDLQRDLKKFHVV